MNTVSAARKMNVEHPPELKGFHKKSFFFALLVFSIPAVAGGVALYRQEAFSANDTLQSVLHWVFMGGIGLFMLTVFYFALFALPKCPECRRRMRQLETVDIAEKTVFNLENTSRWRIVECPHCHLRFRIHGLTRGEA